MKNSYGPKASNGTGKSGTSGQSRSIRISSFRRLKGSSTPRRVTISVSDLEGRDGQSGKKTSKMPTKTLTNRYGRPEMSLSPSRVTIFDGEGHVIGHIDPLTRDRYDIDGRLVSKLGAAGWDTDDIPHVEIDSKKTQIKQNRLAPWWGRKM